MGHGYWAVFFFDDLITDETPPYFPIVYVIVVEDDMENFQIDHVLVRPRTGLQGVVDLVLKRIKKASERPKAVTLARDAMVDGIEPLLKP